MGPEKIVRVVVDTNVLISALLFGGIPGKLIPHWKSGRLRPFLSAPILKEYLKVLAYPRFELTEPEIHFLLYREILPCFQVVSVADDAAVIEADPSDDKFLHCASAAGVDAIVSGDRHLLALGSFHGISILTPVRLLETIQAG